MILGGRKNRKACHEHAGIGQLSSLRQGRFVVTKMVGAEAVRLISSFDVFRNDQK